MRICINYPPLVYMRSNQNLRFCIQYGVYNVKYSILYTIQCILYGISYNFIMCRIDFIMCRIRDFALFLVKICRIIQKYPPFCRKDFFQKTMVAFCPAGQKISMLGRDTNQHLLYIIFILYCQEKNIYNFPYCIKYKKYCIQ